MDCKATVKIGEYSRGGQTRGDNQARDHDMDCKEKYTPCGIVDEDTGALHISFGSSFKTSDFMVDNLQAWWASLTVQQQQETQQIQIKMDNGPESSGVRTQFLKRMVDLASTLGRSIHLLYYPPYHSKYNPNQATPPQADGVWKQICSRILDSDCKPVVFAAERRGIYPY